MSVDIDWETLTTGADGQRLANVIRDFIHERFQHAQLPRLIRSVTVHSFDFGSCPPELVLKDISDPLPDFYENDSDGEPGEGQPTPVPAETQKQHGASSRHNRWNSREQAPDVRPVAAPTPTSFSMASTPGMLGPNTTMNYFQLPLAGHISTRATPLAAVAGAHFQTTAAHHGTSQASAHHHSESFSSISPPSSTTLDTRPTSRDDSHHDALASSAILDEEGTETGSTPLPHEVGPEDLQVVFHVKYGGDIRLCLTADVFLDYPMPSFVGIPLKMTVTGMTFDGVGILAYIKRKAHLCFLSPDDAHALIGNESQLDSATDGDTLPRDEADEDDGSSDRKVAASERVGNLLEDVRIETEMGETEDGRQVLKNVGKIEKFVLEQVQRIFEDEFVYPSFWTFLV